MWNYYNEIIKTNNDSETKRSMITLDTIYNMDCLEGMKQIPDLGTM